MYGDYEFEVQLVFSNAETKVGGCNFKPANRLDPRTMAHVPITLPPIRFDEPGEYEFRLFVNGEFLERQHFHVHPAETEMKES